jgi:lactoylglutathione lyase
LKNNTLTKHIEKLRIFYEAYFHVTSGGKYINQVKKFSSYFLSFESGTRLEIMQMDSVMESANKLGANHLGFAHFAVSVGSESQVNQLTTKLKKDGYTVLDGPRKTGDGYYESTVLDPEGNRLEITV